MGRLHLKNTTKRSHYEDFQEFYGQYRTLSDYRIDGIMYIDAWKAFAVSHYKKNKLISKIIASTMLFLALAPQGRQIAQEAPPPPSVFLLRLPCVSTGIGNWARRTEDVSVGKAVYTSKFFMGPGNRFAAMTCRLRPNNAGVNFQKLKLSFGMRDNDADSPSATFNLYIDGQKVVSESRTVSPGTPGSVVVDVTNPSNVSLEVVCSSQSRYCDRVYFWDASLEYTLPVPVK